MLIADRTNDADVAGAPLRQIEMAYGTLRSAGQEPCASREGKTERYIRMTLSLAFLAPDIVKAAIDGRLPRGFVLNLKTAVDLREAVGFCVICALWLHQIGASRGGARSRRPLRNAWKARDRIARHFCGRANCSAVLARPRDPAMHGADLRSAFKMVHSKAPRDEKDRRSFRERSWEIWSDSLYDDVDPVTELSGTAFVFDLGDEDAPHYPLEIIDDESYARFDPRTETYPLSADAYGPVFGRFLLGVRILVGLP